MATSPAYRTPPQLVAREYRRRAARAGAPGGGGRYRRVGWMLARICLHLLWWDGVCRLPLLRGLRGEPVVRWQQLARNYCTVANDVGGLLVKLGQFLSLRLDLLPAPVAQELAALQDQMPAAPLESIVALIESELGRPLQEVFAWFSPQPVASASVAQVHLARLYSGEQVVVKVLRPGTPEQFEMDIAFVQRLVGVLNQVRPLRKRIDLPALLAEFSAVTRRELDFSMEGKNAERFAREFANEHTVYIPKVYWMYSGRALLTMENVGYLKLRDLAAIEAAGINRLQIAQEIARIFLQQIFQIHFLHADPHPGNIFIKPLPMPDETHTEFAPGAPVAYRHNRGFQIVLIDFGMAVAIPPQQHAWLREFMLGLGLRDARRIIQAYVKGGLLRPGVDLDRVEAMTADLLDGFQEALVGLLPDMSDPRAQQLFQKHGTLLTYDTPFQIPMELLFMYRSLGTMGAVVKKLDPNFDLSVAATPFVAQTLWQEWQTDSRERVDAIAALGQLLLTSPLKLDQVISQVRRVLSPPALINQLWMQPWRELNIKTEIASQDRQTIRQLEVSIQRLTRTLVAFGVFAAILLCFATFQQMNLLELLHSFSDQYGMLALTLSFTFLLWRSTR